MAERVARGLVRDRERLFLLEVGGSIERPIDVESSAVIEVKARAMPCPQCEGSLAIIDHQAEPGGIRPVKVRCAQCGVARTFFFRLVPHSN